MEINKYKEFLGKLNEAERNELQSLVSSALEKNDERVLQISKFIVLTLLTFFVFKFNLVDNLELFGLSIKSSELLFSVMPSILSITYFVYISVIFRKQELKYLLDTQIKKRYKVATDKPMDTHWLTKMISPFEFNQSMYLFKGKWAIINLPMHLVFFVIYIIPFWVLWDGIKLLIDYNSKTIYDYVLILIPSIVTIYTFVHFVYQIIIGIKDQIDDLIKEKVKENLKD